MAPSNPSSPDTSDRDRSDQDSTTAAGPDLTNGEREALHDLQLGVEHVHRAYADLLSFHHRIGHAMDRLAAAETRLRAAGHTTAANTLRDELLPAGAVDDRWTYELVEDFEDGIRADATAFEAGVREKLANGRRHVSERAQQRTWRDRARSDAWCADSTDGER